MLRAERVPLFLNRIAPLPVFGRGRRCAVCIAVCAWRLRPSGCHRGSSVTIVFTGDSKGGKNMKLAEALQERADLNRSIKQLADRLDDNMLVQEGEKTTEPVPELKKELDAATDRLSRLIACINLTNSQTAADGRTLTELIAEKDACTLKLRIYRDLLKTARSGVFRARGTDIKIEPAIEVAQWQAEVDRLAKQLRLLDNRLQRCNWDTELLEIK